jgi:hypothetical protein
MKKISDESLDSIESWGNVEILRYRKSFKDENFLNSNYFIKYFPKLSKIKVDNIDEEDEPLISQLNTLSTNQKIDIEYGSDSEIYPKMILKQGSVYFWSEKESRFDVIQFEKAWFKYIWGYKNTPNYLILMGNPRDFTFKKALLKTKDVKKELRNVKKAYKKINLNKAYVAIPKKHIVKMNGDILNDYSNYPSLKDLTVIDTFNDYDIPCWKKQILSIPKYINLCVPWIIHEFLDEYHEWEMKAMKIYSELNVKHFIFKIPEDSINKLEEYIKIIAKNPFLARITIKNNDYFSNLMLDLNNLTSKKKENLWDLIKTKEKTVFDSFEIRKSEEFDFLDYE